MTLVFSDLAQQFSELMAMKQDYESNSMPCSGGMRTSQQIAADATQNRGNAVHLQGLIAELQRDMAHQDTLSNAMVLARRVIIARQQAAQEAFANSRQLPPGMSAYQYCTQDGYRSSN